jgi:hypothetical protein
VGRMGVLSAIGEKDAGERESGGALCTAERKSLISCDMTPMWVSMCCRIWSRARDEILSVREWECGVVCNLTINVQ